MAELPRHAAAWKEEAELLDVDVSDIRLDAPPAPSTISRSCSTAPSEHPHVPSEPASAVQGVMRRRLPTSPPTSTGRDDVTAPDPDFLLPPWLCALRFLGKDHGWKQPGIEAIKKSKEKLHRAPLVAGVVTSCKPNGLGDLLVTLKDPSAAIAASVHKKVLLEGNNAQDISVGCVIVLREVPVFRPTHKACYLSITKLTKVLRKDCDAPSKQVISSNATEKSEGSTDTIMMRLLGHERMIPHNNDMTVIKVSLQNQGISDSNNSTSTRDTLNCRTDGHAQQNLNIPNMTCLQSGLSGSTVMFGAKCSTQASNDENLRRPFGNEEMLHISKKLKSDAAPPGDNGETASSRIDTKDNYVSQRNMNTDLGIAEHLHDQCSSIREPMEHQQRDFIAVNAGSAQPTKEYATTINGSLLNPKKAYAEWTDDQLSQLCTDDY